MDASWTAAEDLHSLSFDDPPEYSGYSTPIDVKNEAASGQASRVSTPIVHLSAKPSFASSFPREVKIPLDSFPREVMKQMNLLRNFGTLSDVELAVGTESFRAHKIVLAAASPYFKAIFVGGLTPGETSKLHLSGISPCIMAILLDCIYAGEVTVSHATVCQLLSAAVMFQVSSIIDACCNYLLSLLDPGNVIGIAALAQRHGCESLWERAMHFIERNFVAVSQTDEFLELPTPRVMDIIKRSNLNVADERLVYDAVMRWLKHDEDNRAEKAEAVLKGVRFHHLPEDFLREQLKRCVLIHRSPGLLGYLARIYQDIRGQAKPGTSSDSALVYIVGGYNKSAVDVVECWNPLHPNWELEDGQWNVCTPLPEPRSGIGAAILHGILYVAGGRVHSAPGVWHDSNRFDAYDPLTNQWTRRTNMLYSRHRHGLVALDGFIYAVGGCDRACFLRAAERYDPVRNAWDRIGWLITSRVGAGYAVDQSIYAIGGYDGKDRLRSVEVYNKANTQWTAVASMKEKRSGAGVAAVGKFVYVFGGFDGTTQLNSVERYDVEQDVWHCVTVMSSPRSALAVCLVNERLYCIGGFDGQDFRSDVEMYDPATQSWDSGLALRFPRSGHAVAVSVGSVRRMEAVEAQLPKLPVFSERFGEK